MDAIARLLLATAEQRIRHTMQGAVAKVVGLSIVMLLAGSFAAAGLGCLLTAVWLFLLPYVGAAGAALAVGGLLLLASFCLLAAARPARSPPPPPPVDILPELLRAEVAVLLKDQKGPVLLAALLAGMTAGKSDHT